MAAGGNRDAYCPVCERFIGPVDTCPYCNEDSARNPLLRRLRYAAFGLGLAGLGFLYLMALNREPQTARISEITPTMNFGFVRVTGTVVRVAYVPRNREKADDYFWFDLDDGSGRLRVQAYGEVARTLIDRNLVPGKGSLAEVEGSLRVIADAGLRLRLRSVDGLKISQPRTGRDSAPTPDGWSESGSSQPEPEAAP